MDRMHHTGHFVGLGCLVLLLLITSTLRADRLVPARVHQQPVTPATAGDLLYYESRHALSVGDKGEEAFDLSTSPPGCDEEALVFHEARIVYERRRFGEAAIVQSPPSGCVRCSPLIVRWYHEPTGFVDFQVHIYRKRVIGSCVNATSP